MSQFINARNSVVTESVDGLLRASGGRLGRLDGYPHIKVVVRNDWSRDRVALVSGGGSGHEPSHAGFVGRGMLTAAVCGEVFASPSVDAVLAGILAVTGDAGCLLILKNYTGDRLNFGLAAERARAMGYRVKMVIVDDDIALPEIAQARGLAGTLLVHKIAGAAAEEGRDLDAVASAAERVIAGVRTIGMSLNTCTVPGSERESRIDEGHAELGLGIHGEPGIEQIRFDSAEQAMKRVTDKLAQGLSDAPHVALLNNLGGTSQLEMGILANELARSSVGERIRWMVGPAPLMTAMDMQGFSVSLLPVDSQDEARLEMGVSPPAWPGAYRVEEITVFPVPAEVQSEQLTASAHPERKAFLQRCCELLLETEETLNALDAKSGDGDTGSTLATAARDLIKVLDQLPLADEAALFHAMGAELAKKMGGSSGVLLAIFFMAAGEESAKGADRNQALRAGLARMQEVGGAGLGDRTMIDALHPALEALDSGITEAAHAARAGADATAEITQARAGRSSYVRADKLAGHNDPGAEAVALLFEGLERG